jgi:16S rRNA (cytidine1402-2'-O)-methyltransferase
LSQNTEDEAEVGGERARDRLAAAVECDVARLIGESLAPGLYLVATPIGNLGDITLRALTVLARADIVYCEDTRHSAKLLQHFSIHATTRPLHDHNEDSERTRVLRDLEAGKRIALISDAGTPLISDPGFKLVRDAAAAGYPVVCIPGPSSVIAAMASSGLPTDAFFFAGFLPPKQAARRSRLSELKSVPGSLIFFEAPQRTGESLADMADVLGARDAVMARELTKMHEELARGSLPSLAADVKTRDDLKGEVVLVVGPATAVEVTDADINARLDVALQSMSLKDAAKAVSDALGVAKTRVYDLGLKIKNET